MMQESKQQFKVTYEKDTDSAYIYLTEIQNGVISDTFTCDDLPVRIGGDINLDFDKEGKLRGIEILGASKILPLEILS